MTQYRITPTAERDLRGILVYVAEADGVERALLVHERFFEAFELLAFAPRSGRLREDVTGPDIRWWTVIGFAIVYEAECTPIEILRVLHGMRDLDRVL